MTRGKHATKSANRREQEALALAYAADETSNRLRLELRNRNDTDRRLVQAQAEVTRLRKQRTDETSDRLEVAEAERDAAVAKAEHDLDELAAILNRNQTPITLADHEYDPLYRIFGDKRIAGMIADEPRSNRRAFRGGNIEGRLKENPA
jgi:hypothetical protein